MFKHPRNIVRNPEEVDELDQQAETLLLKFIKGEISLEQYFTFLDEMKEYLDFRQLAAEVGPSFSARPKKRE